MRITTSMMMSRYMRSLNGSSEQLSTDSEQLSSGRAYLRASENPVNASQMIVTNHQLKTISVYQDKISGTTTWLSSAESAVEKINDGVISSISSTLETAASTATSSADENQIDAQALENDQSNLLTSLNAVQGGQYVFGGDASGDPPFKVGTADDYAGYVAAQADDTGNTATDIAPLAGLGESDIVGRLLYLVPATGEDVPVNQISTDAVSAADAQTTFASANTSSADYYNVNNPALKRSIPVDLGSGTQMSGGTVVAGTALDAYTNPLDFLVQSTPSDAGFNNIYDEIGNTASRLADNDTSTVSGSLKFNTATQDSLSLTTAGIGEKEKMLSFLSDKLDTDSQNTTQRLSDLEDLDTVSAYGQYSLHMMVYQASLAISNSILQNNLTNYLK